MKRTLAAMIITFCAGICTHAQSLTTADGEKAMKYLESTRQGVMDATKGLSAAQWNFKSAPDRWSIAEVVEHITAAEDLLYGMVTEQVMKAPPRPGGEDVKKIDELVVAVHT
ncbi:MAG: DinB family protein [Pyrinomonadaceae bacterium]